MVWQHDDDCSNSKEQLCNWNRGGLELYRGILSNADQSPTLQKCKELTNSTINDAYFFDNNCSLGGAMYVGYEKYTWNRVVFRANIVKATSRYPSGGRYGGVAYMISSRFYI